MKTVLITGGARGIGKACVLAFAKNGYKVAFTYKKSHDAAKALADETGAIAICADSTSEEDVNGAVNQVLTAYGKVDCLINNSAVSAFSLFTDITLADWNAMLEENLTSAFLYSRAVIPGMVSAKCGSIINISSMWGITGSSCEVHYSAAKAGLIGMTRALAKELGPSSIRVNAIAPGVIDTDMNASLSAEDRAVLADETPLMRIGTPDEIANIALFLAGEGASFITGEVINASGGYVI